MRQFPENNEKKIGNHLSLPGHRVNVDLLGLGDELAEFGKKQLFFSKQSNSNWEIVPDDHGVVLAQPDRLGLVQVSLQVLDHHKSHLFNKKIPFPKKFVIFFNYLVVVRDVHGCPAEDVGRPHQTGEADLVAKVLGAAQVLELLPPFECLIFYLFFFIWGLV